MFCHDRTAVIHQLGLLLCFVCPCCAAKHGETGAYIETSAEEMHLRCVFECSQKFGKSRPGIQNFQV